MLKLACTLPNLAKICLPKSNSAKFYPVTESDRNYLKKVCDDMVSGHSIVFTSKTVVDEMLNRRSSNLCKSIVGLTSANFTRIRCVNT